MQRVLRRLFPAGASPLGHIGYWTAAVAILVMGWALYSAARDVRAASGSADRSLRVLESISAIEANIARAEAAQGGYLAFRDADMLRRRDAAARTARAQVDRLSDFAMEPVERERLTRLRDLVDERLLVMVENESLAGQGPERIASLRGRALRLGGRIETILSQHRAQQLQTLARLRDEEHSAYDRALAILVGAVIAVIAVMIPGYVGFVREARGRESAERLMTSLANTLPGALVQYRMQPDGSGRYEYLSEGAVRLRGIDREAALRDSSVVLDTIFEPDRAEFLAALAEGARTLSRVECDYRVRVPGAEPRWIRTSAMPRRDADGSVIWSAYWSDVTEQKRLERELREAKESAEAATRAKSTFLATMSHEIRTPMNGVLGMLELLSLTDLNAEQRTTLQVIRESGRSLQRIIDDILDYSKIEAGKLELRPEAASIADIVVRVRDIYAGNASSKGLLLRHEVDRRISPAVIVDPLRLQQILNNLVSNAIKFTSEGEVAIRAELVERSDGEDSVRITVSDTGIGIAPAEQLRLFQPFSQADSAIRPDGTGLGLSISRRLAHMMGGEITMQSEPGRGTIMTVALRLPVADGSVPRAPEAAAPAVASDAARGRRAVPSIAQARAENTLLLLVDDHPINRMVLAKQVAALGYAAITAEHGVEAFAAWSGERFAAVITDCNMPEMNGYELTARIRAEERASGRSPTPIIACTANALGGEAEKCLAAGMDDYLPKPIALAQLAAKLDRWVPLPPESPAPAEKVPLAAGDPVDRSVLEQVTGGDPDDERELLARFRKHHAEDVARLTMAARGWNLRELRESAHRIKGSSRTIGAGPLADACEAVERACAAGQLDGARQAWPRLEAEIARLDAWLDALALPVPP